MMFGVKTCHFSLDLCPNLFSWLKGILVYTSMVHTYSESTAA